MLSPLLPAAVFSPSELDESAAVGGADARAPLQEQLAAVVLVDRQLDEREPIVRLGLRDGLDQLALGVAAHREGLALPRREGVAVGGGLTCLMNGFGVCINDWTDGSRT